MNELLLSEINSEQKNLLSAIALIEEHVFNQCPPYEASLDKLVNECQVALNGIEDSMDRAECFINEIYVGQLFLDNQRLLWPVVSQQLVQSIDFKIISPVLKAVIIEQVAIECGLEAELIYVPEKIMVRIICDEVYSIIFDPISGESLNGQQLDDRLDELDHAHNEVFLAAMEKQSVIVEHLSALKNSLINEMMFDKALKCVDLLLALRPNDPFERRDRGFLLHQLDCFKVAYDDYQFFVNECPKDPAAQLLKMQLDQITVAETVLH